MSPKSALQAILLHSLPSEETSTDFARCLATVQSHASHVTQGPWTSGPERTTEVITRQGKTLQAFYLRVLRVQSVLTMGARCARAARLMT